MFHELNLMLNLKKIQKAISYIHGKTTTVEKIGFFINEEYMFDHYENIMMNLNSKNFDLILDDKFNSERYGDLLERLADKGWYVQFLQDVIYRYKYKILISHLYVGGSTVKPGTVFSRCKNVLFRVFNRLGKKTNTHVNIHQQYLQNIIGDINIRFMYGADAGVNSFYEYGNNYCELFDLFFCHGPRDAEITKNVFNKPIYIMGEPRYDQFFEKWCDPVHMVNLREKYSVDNKKKTILFITTVSDYFSTIETYAESMRKLLVSYNVIIRPHPLEVNPRSSRFNQKVLDIVTSGDFVFCGDLYQDMSELYLISDYVFCDYGASIFSAIYMGKRIILLNHEGVKKDSVISTSTALEVRKYLPSINQHEDNFLSYLEADWTRWDKAKEKASDHYFGKINTDASKRAALYLSNMLGG